MKIPKKKKLWGVGVGGCQGGCEELKFFLKIQKKNIYFFFWGGGGGSRGGGGEGGRVGGWEGCM